MTQSRTQKTLKNANVSLLFSILTILVGFFSRKIFIDNLSAEVLGLNTVASNLLGFLNLAELGVGAAISYSLYKPLFDNDRQKMIDIITIQGYLYRRVAYTILAGSAILMCFFPWIFHKSDLPLWYAYTTFTVFLFGSMFSYIWNYKQILLTADQKNYKLVINQQSLFSLKIIIQLSAISLFPQIGYQLWILFEFSFSIIRTVELNRIVKKEYPWLNIELSRGKDLLQSHKEIITKTKQIFAHKMAGIVLNQASPMVMYAYTSLTIIAYYGNYMTVIAGLSTLFNSLFNSMGAGVGNLVAEGNKRRINEVFWELLTSRFWIALSISIPLYHLSSPFISLWLGKKYLLDDTTILLMILIFFIGATRGIVESFLSAYGLYQDTWAPFAEATINIILSITLGYFFGIIGVLSGIAISLTTIVLIWKPYFLYSQGFKRSVWSYIVGYLKHLAIAAITFFSSNYLYYQLPYHPSEFISHFLIMGTGITLITAFSSGLLYYIFTPGLKAFFNRLILMLKK
ncbi:MAG: lipopolysaccharide biosynthesis protein [Phocaeicola sp.]